LGAKNTKLEEISQGFEQEQTKWSTYYIKYMTYINNVRKFEDWFKKDQLIIPKNMEKHRKWITKILEGIKEYMKQAKNDNKKTVSARNVLNVMLDNFIIVDEAESEQEINTRISIIMETLFTCSNSFFAVILCLLHVSFYAFKNLSDPLPVFFHIFWDN
jgi:esterase/lipase